MQKEVNKWKKEQMSVGGCGEPLPVFDDAEVKAGEVSGDEGLKGTHDPAGIELTVSICHLRGQTNTNVRGFHSHFRCQLMC